MTKRPSLKAIESHPPSAAAAAAAPATRTTQPSRIGKKVVTVYVDENVWRSIKMMAVTHDTTITALMHHGLDLVFEKYGVNRDAVCKNRASGECSNVFE
jgi:hypothetical protein